MKVLVCNMCDAHLTGPLELRSGKDPEVTHPTHVDRSPLTESGIVFKAYEPIERSMSGEPARLEFTPQYWVNPDDLTKAVQMTKDMRRLNGCCGLDGCDGPNQICDCGAEIGTLRTDCWTPKVFIPVPQATSWIEIS